MRIIPHLCTWAAGLLLSGQVLAQTTKHTGSSSGPTSSAWSFSLTADGYVVPHTELYFSPAAAADHNWKDRNGSFFYSWPELTYSPFDWLRVGLVAQRTKAYHTNLDTQRGFLIGFSHKKLQFTTYVFNAGCTDPTLVFQAGVSF